MTLIDGRTRLEHLLLNECWKLLGSREVGRIGVLIKSAPEVYPVNFATDGRSIVFRTDSGSKLCGLEQNPSVCFEIDSFDVDARVGWSVLVKGRARKLTDLDELRRAAELPLRLWVFGDKPQWFRVQPVEVTGRRLDRPLEEWG